MTEKRKQHGLNNTGKMTTKQKDGQQTVARVSPSVRHAGNEKIGGHNNKIFSRGPVAATAPHTLGRLVDRGSYRRIGRRLLYFIR